jgi:hypothetical protein
MKNYKIKFNGIFNGSDLPAVAKAFPETANITYRDYTVTNGNNKEANISLPMGYTGTIEDYLEKNGI